MLILLMGSYVWPANKLFNFFGVLLFVRFQCWLKMICICNRVDGKEIKKLLRKFPDASVNEIAKLSGASQSCGRCSSQLSAFVEKNRKQGVLPLTLFSRDDF